MSKIPKVTPLPNHRSEDNEANRHYRELLAWSETLKSSELAQVTASFCRNIWMGERLLMLPTMMVIGYYSHQLLEPLNDPELSAEDKSRIIEQIKKTHELRGYPVAETELLVDAILNQNDDAKGAVQALIQSVTSRAWTSFESYARDMWIVCVNSRPQHLGAHAFKSQHKDDDANFSNRSIPFWVLEKHGFDLRKKLGSILADEKFRMNDPVAIKKAYKAAFGKEFPINEIANSKALRELNSIRNLFQHTGGIVDERFRSEVSCSSELGSLYLISREDAEAHLGLSVNCGKQLGTVVDEWLQKHPGAK